MTGKSGSSEVSSSAIRDYSDGPPFVFKGRAVYQLHAVKASVARRFVPPELKLVEAFGYTLGGLFLANYDVSPAGQFDEAVVIAGIVWNPPTSCAWAGRVLVGSEAARVHGRKEIGLPSHFASFSHQVAELSTPNSESSNHRPWWDARGWFSSLGRRTAPKPKLVHSVQIVHQDGRIRLPLCDVVGIPCVQRQTTTDDSSASELQKQRWKGPAIQLSLPNFSGKTKDQPKLLKYSCALTCRVTVVPPARITDLTSGSTEVTDEDEDVVTILKGKPLASMFFDEMVMRVEAPKVVTPVEDDIKKRKKRDQKLLKPAAQDAGPAVGPATPSTA
ncbi:unnamed protein product [Calypogeia fissa]